MYFVDYYVSLEYFFFRVIKFYVVIVGNFVLVKCRLFIEVGNLLFGNNLGVILYV